MPARPTRPPLVHLVALGCALLVVCSSWLAAVPAAAAEPARLVLMLDSSGSMKAKVNGESKISIAKSSLRSVVRTLPSEAPVGLRVYGATVFDRSDEGACTDSQLVVPIGTGNRDRLLDEIAGYQPYGETPISYSLRQGAKDLGGGQGKRTILLVSDGEETCSADPCATAAAIAKNNIEVKIDVVGLAVSGKVRSQLRCVARRGNGTYYDADSRADLEASLDKLASRAFRPFRLTGTPIRGATKKSAAPTAVPGQYLDKLPGSQRPLYYRIPRTAAGSTLRLGFTALPAGSVPGVYFRLYDSEGRMCSSTTALAIAIGGSNPLVSGSISSWRVTEDDPCNSDDELLAEVASANNDMLGAKFELLVSEEPPLADDRDLPAASTSVTWQPMSPAGRPPKPPVPGTSLSDAPSLEPGTYRTSILTGETQVFAVSADWGQRVQVDVRVAPRRGALARALGVSDSLDLKLLGADRGQYVNLRVRRQPPRSYSMIEDADLYRVTAASPVVRYTNRGRSGTENHAATPGPQYVVLNLDQRPDDAFLVPYTIQVKVLGTAGAGRPSYLGVPSPSPTPTPSTTLGSAPPASTPPPEPPPAAGVPVSTVVAVAAAALVLGAGATASALLLRRRRRPGH